MNEQLKTLQSWIESSSSIVFFGGAGVSTESGIPDFRSVDGLYNQSFNYPPEEILSKTFFSECPEVFFKFYREKLCITGAKPNPAHFGLAKLESAGNLSAVVTQNIDGLHQAAGSHNVLELHGSLLRNYCVKCGKRYSYEHMIAEKDIPRCSCGGILRPDIVLYEENLDETVLRRSVELISRADMLIVGGTSLAVYPAAGLINYYHGRRLAVINKDPSASDDFADLSVCGKIGEIFSQLNL